MIYNAQIVRSKLYVNTFRNRSLCQTLKTSSSSRISSLLVELLPGRTTTFCTVPLSRREHIKEKNCLNHKTCKLQFLLCLHTLKAHRGGRWQCGYLHLLYPFNDCTISSSPCAGMLLAQYKETGRQYIILLSNFFAFKCTLD